MFFLLFSISKLKKVISQHSSYLAQTVYDWEQLNKSEEEHDLLTITIFRTVILVSNNLSTFHHPRINRLGKNVITRPGEAEAILQTPL